MFQNNPQASSTQRINCSEESEAVSIWSTGTVQRHHLEQKTIEVRCNFDDQLISRPTYKTHRIKISDSATSADTTSTCASLHNAVGDKESLAPVSTSVQHSSTRKSVNRPAQTTVLARLPNELIVQIMRGLDRCTSALLGVTCTRLYEVHFALNGPTRLKERSYELEGKSIVLTGRSSTFTTTRATISAREIPTF